MNTDFTNKDQTISNLQYALAIMALRASDAERKLGICVTALNSIQCEAPDSENALAKFDCHYEYGEKSLHFILAQTARQTLEEIK